MWLNIYHYFHVLILIFLQISDHSLHNSQVINNLYECLQRLKIREIYRPDRFLKSPSLTYTALFFKGALEGIYKSQKISSNSIKQIK